jgi:hypothetical protein
MQLENPSTSKILSLKEINSLVTSIFQLLTFNFKKPVETDSNSTLQFSCVHEISQIFYSLITLTFRHVNN